MRRNLVGKKLPQNLIKRGEHSGFVDWSGATTLQAVLDHHDATAGMWDMSSGNTGHAVYFQLNDPALPFQKHDILAGTNTQWSHLSGEYILYPDDSASNPLPALGYVSSGDTGYAGVWQRWDDPYGNTFNIGASEIVSNPQGLAGVNADGRLELPGNAVSVTSVDLGAAGITWTRGAVLIKVYSLRTPADVTWTSNGVTTSLADLAYKDGYDSAKGFYTHFALPVYGGLGGTLAVALGSASIIIDEVYCVHEDPNSTATLGGGSAFALLGGNANSDRPWIVDRTTNDAYKILGDHVIANYRNLGAGGRPDYNPEYLFGNVSALCGIDAWCIDVTKACDHFGIDYADADFYQSIEYSVKYPASPSGSSPIIAGVPFPYQSHPQSTNLRWFHEAQLRFGFSSVTVNVGDTWDGDMSIVEYKNLLLEGNSFDQRWGFSATEIDGSYSFDTSADTDPNGFTTSSETIVIQAMAGKASNFPATPSLLTSLPSDYQYTSVRLNGITPGKFPHQSASYIENYGDVGPAPYSEWYNNGNWYMETSADVHNWPDLQSISTVNASKFGVLDYHILVIG